ncbi:hypothetical protein G6F22_014803 [Rhizopus arrhizus]|nr:hypothetical protein G6F22_014803 [Rhizopus arrhizus]
MKPKWPRPNRPCVHACPRPRSPVAWSCSNDPDRQRPLSGPDRRRLCRRAADAHRDPVQRSGHRRGRHRRRPAAGAREDQAPGPGRDHAGRGNAAHGRAGVPGKPDAPASTAGGDDLLADRARRRHHPAGIVTGRRRFRLQAQARCGPWAAGLCRRDHRQGEDGGTLAGAPAGARCHAKAHARSRPGDAPGRAAVPYHRPPDRDRLIRRWHRSPARGAGRPARRRAGRGDDPAPAGQFQHGLRRAPGPALGDGRARGQRRRSGVARACLPAPGRQAPAHHP